MKTFIGNILDDGLTFAEPIQRQYDSLIKSMPSGQVVEITVKPIKRKKAQAQLGGIFGVWLEIIVDKMNELGVNLYQSLGGKTYQVRPNKQNVLDLLYATCGRGKTLSKMDIAEVSQFMSDVQDFCAENECLGNLVLPKLKR